MNRRATGCIFMIISTFLLGIKYICAYMIVLSRPPNPFGKEIYLEHLQYVSGPIDVVIVITAIVGALYLFFAEKHFHCDKCEEKLDT